MFFLQNPVAPNGYNIAQFIILLERYTSVSNHCFPSETIFSHTAIIHLISQSGLKLLAPILSCLWIILFPPLATNCLDSRRWSSNEENSMQEPGFNKNESTANLSICDSCLWDRAQEIMTWLSLPFLPSTFLDFIWSIYLSPSSFLMLFEPNKLDAMLLLNNASISNSCLLVSGKLRIPICSSVQFQGFGIHLQKVSDKCRSAWLTLVPH